MSSHSFRHSLHPCSTSRDPRRSQQPAPHPSAVSGPVPPSSDHNLDAEWKNVPSDTSHSGPYSQPRVDYNLPSLIQHSLGQQCPSSSKHHGPFTPHALAREADARLATVQRCIIPGCQYPAFYNVAEQEQTEYCGHGHELQAIETGFAQCCAMCRSRPRRSGERVCGSVCRERERNVCPPQGHYYGVPVTRREPAIPTNRAPSPVPVVPVVPTAPIAPVFPFSSVVSIVPTAPIVPTVPILPTPPTYEYVDVDIHSWMHSRTLT